MIDSIFTELSLLIILATIVSIVIRWLKQPLIIGYIITGIILGPVFLNKINDGHLLGSLGEFGITLLHFIAGLSLNTRLLKELGKVSAINGTLQVLASSIIGFGIGKAIGLDTTPALYLGVGLAFSSTIVVLKLLADRQETTQLHGRMAIGLLLMQDLLASVVLIVASSSKSGGLAVNEVGWLLAKYVLVTALIYIATRFVFRHLGTYASHSREMLFLFALSWGLGISVLFYKVGLSHEVGALFAGVMLAPMAYAQDVSSRLRPLRDFFVIVFFISLGSGLHFSTIGSIWWQAIILLILVTIIKPIIILSLMGMMGYAKKTSFKTAVTVAQVSEFSFILLALAKHNNQVSESHLTLLTITAVGSYITSSYMIVYANQIYTKLANALSVFERTKSRSESNKNHHYDAVIIGYKKGGAEFAKAFKKINKKFLIVDYDPEVIEEVSHKGYDYIFGDVTDTELLDEVHLGSTKSVISTVTDQEATEIIVKHALRTNPKAVIICSADSARHATELYEDGATYVMMPHTIGTEKISNFISRHGLKKSEFKAFRDRHLLHLADYINELPSKQHRRLGRVVVRKMAQLALLTKKPSKKAG